MDGDDFDSLVQQLTQARSRRRALAGLLGGVLAGTLRGEVGAKPKGRGRGVKTAQHTKRRPSAADAKCRSTGQTCSEKHPCCASLACEPREHGSGRCAPCIPKTCAELGKNCGPVSDTCGGIISCGECAAPNTCGGGGTPNVCGLPPVACSSTGSCPPGAECTNSECRCFHKPCPQGDATTCTPFSGEVCNPPESTLRCCCSPNGNPSLACGPASAPNIICCSGFCGSDGRCADPPI
jgi:hypothetical protein